MDEHINTESSNPGRSILSTVNKALLLFLPVCFLLFGLNFHRTLYSNDPEYAYLLNGLNIATGKWVGHAENPGTTVQWLAAAVIRIRFAVTPSEGKSISEQVLLYPDDYINSIRQVLVIINALMILITGLISLRITRLLWPSVLLQTGYFISANTLEHVWTKVSPEPLLLMASGIMALLILSHFHRKEEIKSKGIGLFPLATAFGFVTKATFLPLWIIPFLLAKGKKEKIRLIRNAVIICLLLLIPAIPEFPHMGKWFLMLFLHKGTYGGGGLGVIDFSVYFTDLLLIARNNPLLVITAMISSGLYLLSLLTPKWRNRLRECHALRYSGIIGIAQLIAILAVAKHYHANHYLLPVNAVTALNWYFMIHSSICLFRISGAGRILLPYSVITLFLAVSLSGYSYLRLADYGYRITNEEYDKVIRTLDRNYPGYLICWYYPTSINPYSALKWGNTYSRNSYLERLEKLYPSVFFFDTRYKGFSKWETRVDPGLLFLAAHGKMLLIGGPLQKSEIPEIVNDGFSLHPVYEGRTQSIYRIDVSDSTIFR